MGWATSGGDECLVRRVVDDLIVARVYQRVDLGQSERGDYLAWRLWWRDMARGIPPREWLNLATCHVAHASARCQRPAGRRCAHVWPIRSPKPSPYARPMNEGWESARASVRARERARERASERKARTAACAHARGVRSVLHGLVGACACACAMVGCACVGWGRVLREAALR